MRKRAETNRSTTRTKKRRLPDSDDDGDVIGSDWERGWADE